MKSISITSLIPGGIINEFQDAIKIYFLFFNFISFFMPAEYWSTELLFKNRYKSDRQRDWNWGISEYHGQIDLSQSTLEQQKIEKKQAAEKLQEARNERIEIEVENSNDFLNEINVAKFARDTIHKKGEKLFSRIGLNTYNNWNQCSKFKTKDDAQRHFLKTGGPYSDKFNLDPDGDGFACDWDPEVYRGLTIPKD